MKTTFNIFIAIILLALCNDLIAQIPSPIEDVTFPSPEASSLGKFGGVEINKSSGLPTPSIPVYSIHEGDINLNINLSYYYSGFKPSDEPSWVGLGWSLNTGGVISRTIRGQRDETPGSGYLAQASNIESFVNMSPNPNLNDFNNLNAFGGSIDTQQDLFTFNFMGHSGKFVFAPDGSVKTLSASKYIITPQISSSYSPHNNSGQMITKWTLTSESGVIYEFEAFEFSEGAGTGDIWETTAWYLTKVKSLKGYEVNFTYTSPNTSKRRWQLSRNEQQFVYDEGDSNGSEHTVSLSQNRSEEIFLQTISGSLWQIDFISQEYSKVIGTTLTSYYRKLNSIEVKDKTQSPAEVVKRFNFHYNNSNFFQLESFEEEGNEPYLMDYHGTPSNGIDGFTRAVDYWGYYNGQANTTLIPDLGADLEPRVEMTKIGALERLVYPTKGFVQFEYELNDYSYYGTSLTSNNRIVVDEYYYEWNDGPPTAPNPTFTLSENTEIDFRLESGATNNPNWQCSGLEAWQSKVLSAGTYTANDVLNWPEFYPCNQNENQVGFDVSITVKVFREINESVVNHGGLRLRSKIEDPDGGEVLTSVYSYKTFSNSTISSGIITNKPVYSLFDINGLTNSLYRSSALNPMSLGSLYYKDLKESNSEYYTEFTFTSDSDVPPIATGERGKWAYIFFHTSNGNGGDQLWSSTSNLDIGLNEDYSNFKKLPKTIVTKDLSGIIKSKTTINYQLDIPTSGFATLYRTPLVSYSSGSGSHTLEYYKSLYQRILWPRKISESIEEYGSDGSLNKTTQISEFEYSNPNHLQITKKSVSLSDGNTLETSYKYPLDYQNVTGRAAFITSMINKNLVVVPIETISRKVFTNSTSKVVDASLVLFKNYSLQGGISSPLPYKQFMFNGKDGSVSNLSPYAGTSGENSPAGYYEKVRINGYDTGGHYVSTTVLGQDNYGYLWAYKGHYPIAKISNVTLAGLNSALSSAGTSLNALFSNTNRVDIESKLNSIRSGLTASLVEGYSYTPLEGLASKIAPNGLKSSFVYDDLERLIQVKDNLGNTVKSYSYGFKEDIP